jgi:hypothetical protein
MENKRYTDIIGNANAPYLNQLAANYGLETQFFAETHPSLPNYIAMTSGSTQGITDDSGPSSHPLNVPNVFQQFGTGQRSLAEGMPSNCFKSNSGDYAVRHNVATYYTYLDSQALCATQDSPLTATLDLSAKFTSIVPNLCHDMHSCSTTSDKQQEIRNGDTWLKSFVPRLQATPQYQEGSTVIFITWDEDDYSSNQQVGTFVISPLTLPGARNATRLTHYSMLRYLEENFGYPPIANAVTAPRMNGSLGL